MRAITTTVDTSILNSTGGKSRFFGINVVAAAAAASCRVYDNTQASGPTIAFVKAVANESESVILPEAIWAGQGLYLDVSGTGVVATLYWG